MLTERIYYGDLNDITHQLFSKASLNIASYLKGLNLYPSPL